MISSTSNAPTGRTKPWGPFQLADQATASLRSLGIKDADAIALALKSDIDEYWDMANGHRTRGGDTFVFTAPMLDLALSASDVFIPSVAYLDLICQHPALDPVTQRYLAGLFFRIWQSGKGSTRLPVRGPHDAVFCMRCLLSNPNLDNDAMRLLLTVPDLASTFADRLGKFPNVTDEVLVHLPVLEGPDLVETVRGLLARPQHMTEAQACRVLQGAFERWDDIERDGRVFPRTTYSPPRSDVVDLLRLVAGSPALNNPDIPEQTRSFFLVRIAADL